MSFDSVSAPIDARGQRQADAAAHAAVGPVAMAPTGTAPIGTARDAAWTPLWSTARLLGLSCEQLAAALKAGASLRQLAAHTGVPADLVHDSVAADLRHDAPGDAGALSDLQLDQIATGIRSARVPAADPVPAPVRFDAYA